MLQRPSFQGNGHVVFQTTLPLLCNFIYSSCSLKPAPGPVLKSGSSLNITSSLFNTHFNIILLYTVRPFKRSYLFRLNEKKIFAFVFSPNLDNFMSHFIFGLHAWKAVLSHWQLMMGGNTYCVPAGIMTPGSKNAAFLWNIVQSVDELSLLQIVRYLNIFCNITQYKLSRENDVKYLHYSLLRHIR